MSVFVRGGSLHSRAFLPTLTEAIERGTPAVPVEKIENFVSKALSLAMVIVILVAVGDLGLVLAKQLFAPPYGFLGKTLIEIFGLLMRGTKMRSKAK